MPLYEYKCPVEHITEVLRPMDRRHDQVECKYCGDKAMLVVGTPAVNVVESMVERLNRNYKKRQDKAKRGELLR